MVKRQGVLFNKSTAGSKGTGCYICGGDGHAAKTCPTLKGGRPNDPPQKYKDYGEFTVDMPKGGEIVGTKKRKAAAKPENVVSSAPLEITGAARAGGSVKTLAERDGGNMPIRKKGQKMKTKEDKVRTLIWGESTDPCEEDACWLTRSHITRVLELTDRRDGSLV